MGNPAQFLCYISCCRIVKQDYPDTNSYEGYCVFFWEHEFIKIEPANQVRYYVMNSIFGNGNTICAIIGSFHNVPCLKHNIFGYEINTSKLWKPVATTFIAISNSQSADISRLQALCVSTDFELILSSLILIE